MKMETTSTTQTESNLPRILCVDDEPIILEVLEVQLSDDFDVTLATSGEEGLKLLKTKKPFAVIVSDMQMPNMDGATFLQHARSLSRDTTQVMLTGQADLDSSIKAINMGNIFRFLRKPCPPKS